ncbi:Permease of the drug/metabolite transporter (DMT) superfamily [Desulforamulus putei DSM 12395]|uniref:Permease of the drug/metabolite transporter (DMT) superfamily n=2 Tax=Desulforamulus putei TaxID=74701 RepID=A0A1M4T9R0_9FIRM|nr:EamA family transporter [Desulforamulus putei]SHE41246.1 Permease of the drug/metabolite transporter (DMT) superfamily [Desulforamulus putei DSM 12395]
MFSYFMLALATFAWGGAFVAAKMVVTELHPLVAAVARFWLAFLCLIPFMLWKERGKAGVALKDWPVLIFLGFSGIFLYNVLFFNGLRISAAMDGSLLVACGPVLTAILSALVLQERLNFRQAMGFLVSLCGVVVIVTKGVPSALLVWDINPGDIMLTCSALTWSFYSVGGKVVMKRLSPVVSTTYAMGIGAAMLTLAAIPQLTENPFANMTQTSVVGLGYLAVIASALSFVLWFEGIKRVGAGKASIFQNIVPLSGALLSILLLGEKLQAFHPIGALLILGGVYMVTKPARAPKAAVTGGVRQSSQEI